MKITSVYNWRRDHFFPYTFILCSSIPVFPSHGGLWVWFTAHSPLSVPSSSPFLLALCEHHTSQQGVNFQWTLLGAPPQCFVQGFGVSCLSLPLFHASVGMEMFGDRVGSGLWAWCCSPLAAGCLTHRLCLPHAPVPGVARNAPGNTAQTARPKSALPEISLQSQALLRPRAGECRQRRGRCKSASQRALIKCGWRQRSVT